MSTLEKQFDQAAVAVKDLKSRPDNDTLLRLYALYKQGSAGDVSGKRPGFTDFVGRAKYDAWKALKGTGREEAMEAYVNLVTELREREQADE